MYLSQKECHKDDVQQVPLKRTVYDYVCTHLNRRHQILIVLVRLDVQGMANSIVITISHNYVFNVRVIIMYLIVSEFWLNLNLQVLNSSDSRFRILISVLMWFMYYRICTQFMHVGPIHNIIMLEKAKKLQNYEGQTAELYSNGTKPLNVRCTVDIVIDNVVL